MTCPTYLLLISTPFPAQKFFTFQTANNNFLTMTITYVTIELSKLTITMHDQGARSAKTRQQLRRPAATQWSPLLMDPSLTWDHSGDTASNMMTASHHYQDGNLIPLLPCYYQLDIACFIGKVGHPIPNGAVVFVNDFQFKYHETWNNFEVYTGIPVPALYEAQHADFNILLNYLPLDYFSHPKNTALNLSSLLHYSMSAQFKGPSLGNSPQLVPSTVNHSLDAAKDNTNTITFVNRGISNSEQNNVYNSVSCALMSSHA